MKCPTCQIDNPKTAHFCQDCGTRLDVSGLAPGPEKGQAAPADRPSFTKTLDTPSGELPRGTVFAGRYEIIEELGTGGMGRVYRAYDRKIEEEIALKLIRPEIAAEKRTVERFRNEIKIARKITHKNVCRTHDLGEEGKGFFITMEYVRGEDLKSLIRRTRALASATAVAYARQVAEGLGEAHRLGIVHRDLKPGNIMIDKDGQAKIMDFGIARSLAGGGATAEGAIVGTPEYMSPEQVEGKPADQRADIYALGVILFEMVTGRTPFEGETVMAVAHKHLYEAAPDPGALNPDIPAALGRLILRCLEKEREKRYQGTGELLADLEAVEAALPTAEHVAPKRKTITPREVTVKLPSRKVLVAAAAALALVVGGYAVWRLIIRPPVSPVPPGLPAAAAAAKKPLLAIPDFENISNDESLDYLRAGLPELLIPGLGQSRLLRVLRRDEIQEILKKLKLEEAKKYSIAQVKSISENGGASSVLTGSFMKAGDGILITVYLIDPRTGETVRSLSAKAGDEAAVMAEVDGLIPEIKRGLGLDPDAIAKDINKSVSQLATASPEALKLGRTLSAAAAIRLLKDLEQHLYRRKKRIASEKGELELVFGAENAYAVLNNRLLNPAAGQGDSGGAVNYQRMAIFGRDQVSELPTSKKRLKVDSEPWTLLNGRATRAPKASDSRLLAPCLVAAHVGGKSRLGVMSSLQCDADGTLSAQLSWYDDSAEAGNLKRFAPKGTKLVRVPAFLLRHGEAYSLIVPADAGVRLGVTLELTDLSLEELIPAEVVERGTDFVLLACRIKQ